MTVPNTPTAREAATGCRRAAQILRAYRRKDVPAMNLVITEMQKDNSGSDMLFALIGFTSELLDLAAPDHVEALLADLVLDYAKLEKSLTSSPLKW